MMPRGITTSASTSASNGAAAVSVKAPVHTIHHTKLKRGKELGQVEKIEAVAQIHMLYISICTYALQYIVM